MSSSALDRIRIIRHSVITDSGSFEVRYSDGRNPKYFYWDDNKGRRDVTGRMTQEEAKLKAQDMARKD